MIGAIFVRYWVQKDYNAVLAGIDKTTARKVVMVGHMSLGAVCLLLGPFQFLQIIRWKWPSIHRWTGRVYVISALLCSLLGEVFIFLKGFILVGGVNMGIAFFVAGFAFGLTAFLTAFYARRGQWVRHRNWAIRAYSQILAPMLYRYFYTLMGGLHIYPDHDDLGDLEDRCDDNDICEPFTFTLDAIHAWTYFIAPLIFAELIVQSLPAKESRLGTTTSVGELEPLEEGADQVDNGVETEEGFSYRNLNLLGILGALFSVAGTLVIYISTALDTNTVSTR